MEESGSGSEHRSYVRLDGPLLASYTIGTGDEFAWAHTQTYDIGPGGCAMLTNVELPVGQTVHIDLELKGDDRPKLRLTGTVRWSRHDEFVGQYRTGIEFIDRSPEQEQALLRYIDTIYRLRDLGVLH